MRPNLARNIDYWIGIPLCFFISLFYRIERIFSLRKVKREIPCKKIMFLELSEMGAAILSYSALRKVKEMYPDARLYFWIFKENVESVYILDIIPKENVITTKSKNLWLLFIDTLMNLWQIRKEKIDVIIDLELFSRFTSILCYLSGAEIRVGFHRFSLEGLYRAEIYTHKVMYNPHMHMSRNFLALINSLKAPLETPLLKAPLVEEEVFVPRVSSHKEDEENIWLKLKDINSQISPKNKIVILNVGLGEHLPLRRWPIENYIRLTEKLLQDKGICVVLIGIKSEAEEINKMQHLLNSSRCINLIGKTTIKELVDLCNISCLLISHDSGAVNFASLTPINIIVLFGPETPLLYAPLNSNNQTIFYKNLSCSPCFSAYNHRTSFCRDNRCLKTITVDEVYEAARRYLYIDI